MGSSASTPRCGRDYETICYTVRLKGFATAEQFQELHETVARTSPNYFNITRPVKVLARLVVE